MAVALAVGCSEPDVSWGVGPHPGTAAGRTPADVSGHTGLADMASARTDGDVPERPGQQFAACAGQSGLQAGSPWPMAGHDAAATGRTTALGPTMPKLLSTANVAGEIYGIAVAADGTVYVTAGWGALLALRDDLSVKWQFSAGHGGPIQQPVIRADGVIYVTTEDYDRGAGALHAIKPTGEILWSVERSMTPLAGGDVFTFSPTVGCDGTAYFVQGHVDTTRLFAISTTGHEIWRVDQVPEGTPLIAPSGTIYLSNGTTLALNPDGSTWWSALPYPCRGLSAIGDDGSLHAPDSACRPDGVLKWRSGGAWAGDVAIGRDGTYYSFGWTGGIALGANGALAWTSNYPWTPPLGSDIHASPVALDGAGVLFVAVSNSGAGFGTTPSGPASAMVFAIDSRTGARLWSYDLGSFCVPTAIAIGTSRRLYVVCGQLYAFGNR